MGRILIISVHNQSDGCSSNLSLKFANDCENALPSDLKTKLMLQSKIGRNLLPAAKSGVVDQNT